MTFSDLRYILATLFLSITFSFKALSVDEKIPPLVYSHVGDSITTTDGALKIKCIGQKHGYGRGKNIDTDIYSPKSAAFTPSGEKFYVNSLEGCKTVVYETDSLKKSKIILHEFNSGEGETWLAPSGFYNFTHYPDGQKRKFKGKPVEEAISKDGKYLFVPYYRRTFDINAQDPSALAVIDTETDSIILMTETGPLPKMVTVSNNGNLLAITHWGDNTVGFMDISNPDPHKWFHLPPVTIGYKLKLNYSLSESVDRDTGSGYALRGTVFLPGDSLLLVAGMGGPTAIVDLKEMKYLGMINSLNQMRHVAVNKDKVFMSRNASGEVYSVPLDSIVKGVGSSKNGKKEFKVGGIRKVKVGGGARTLKLSPDGRYIFVACNSGSALYIVNAESMKVVGQIPVDSYPVGLDVSPNGQYVVVTSQGRSVKGGNAVNIFEIDYLYEADQDTTSAYTGLDAKFDNLNNGLGRIGNDKSDLYEKEIPFITEIILIILTLSLGIMVLVKRRHFRHH